MRPGRGEGVGNRREGGEVKYNISFSGYGAWNRKGAGCRDVSEGKAGRSDPPGASP